MFFNVYDKSRIIQITLPPVPGSLKVGAEMICQELGAATSPSRFYAVKEHRHTSFVAHFRKLDDLCAIAL